MPKPVPKGFAAALRAHALSFPEATEDFPWGERAFKVRGKAFVFMSSDKDELSFSAKLPRTGVQALALPFTEPTHYGLGKHGWVTVRVPKRVSSALREQCLAWVTESYLAVAPKKLAQSVE